MEFPEEQESLQATAIAENLKKINEGSFFSFDKDYASSNSVDGAFLQSLIDNNDSDSFADSYLNG